MHDLHQYPSFRKGLFPRNFARENKTFAKFSEFTVQNSHKVNICCRFTDQSATKIQLERANIMKNVAKHMKLVTEAAAIGKVITIYLFIKF